MFPHPLTTRRMEMEVEAKERELTQNNEEISLLENQLIGSQNEFENLEKCLETAYLRASDLEKKNQKLMDRNAELSKNLEHSVTKIDVLQSKICVLSNELSEARKTQDTKLSEIRSAVLQHCHTQLSQ